MGDAPFLPERPNPSQIEDLRLAVAQLKWAPRCAFQAEMTQKYCEGHPRLAESIFGWRRQTMALGLAEKQIGLVCVGAQSGFAGIDKWEERYPEAAATLVAIAAAQSQQDPSFTTSVAYTRLTARQPRTQGVSKEPLPARSTMAVILNRLGYRLRPVVKAKPPKNEARNGLNF